MGARAVSNVPPFILFSDTTNLYHGFLWQLNNHLDTIRQIGINAWCMHGLFIVFFFLFFFFFVCLFVFLFCFVCFFFIQQLFFNFMNCVNAVIETMCMN